MDKHKSEDVTRRLVRFRTISVLLAWLVMPLPFFVYFTNNQSVMLQYSYQSPTANLIWIMLLANVLAYIAVSLWTIQIAKQTLFIDKLKASISVRFANRPVIARWWSAVEQTWQWNVLAAIPRLGLVMGIAHLFSTDIDYACQQLNLAKFLFQPYCYGTMYRYNDQPNVNLLIGCFLLLLFALFNNGFLCSLSQRYLSQSLYHTITIIFAKRMKVVLWFMAFIFVFEVVLVMMQPLVTNEGQTYVCETNPYYFRTTPYGTCWNYRRGEAAKTILPSVQFYDRVVDLEVILWSFVDNGVMLTSNVMSLRGYSPVSAVHTINHVMINPPDKDKAIQYLQYFASQLLLAFISLSLMALETYRYLRRMERLDIGRDAHGQA